MKIFKGKYNWQTLAKSKNKDGSETKLYIDVQFPKGEEPDSEIDGDLIFKTEDGEEKRCFLSCYSKSDGSVHAKIGFNKTRNNEIDDSMFGYTNPNIEKDELPFY